MSDEWKEPKVPADVAWNLMTMPERALESLMLPMYALVSAAERYHLDERARAITGGSPSSGGSAVTVSPVFKWGVSNGVGLGAAVTWNSFFDGPEYWKASGVIRRNGDYNLRTEYAQIWEPRKLRWLEAHIDYDVDTDEPFYGIGADTPEEDKRTISDSRLDLAGIFDVYARGVGRYKLRLHVGLLNHKLGPGDPDAGQPPLTASSTEPPPPPGFGDDVTHARTAIEFAFDSRNREGRPTRGSFAYAVGTVSSTPNGDQASAQGKMFAAHYIELLPYYRVLVLRGGVGGVRGLGGADIPLYQYIRGSRETLFRGYDRERFLGELGWVGSAEFRYLAGEYLDTNVGAEIGLFAEAGQIGDSPSEWLNQPLRFSWGLTGRLSHTSKVIASFTVGFSEEGTAWAASWGKEL